MGARGLRRRRAVRVGPDHGGLVVVTTANYPAPKPWLACMQGETADEWRERLRHTCYYCGHWEADTADLATHEGQHKARGDD